MRSWLPNDLDPRAYASIGAALEDVGEHEDPLGSNRGPYVDAVNATEGSPLGSAWCANAGTKWVKAGGLWVPGHDNGSCQAWYRAALVAGRVMSKPELPCVALYGHHQHASHWGLVVCLTPLLDVEGNTSLDGYSRDGEIVQLKPVRLELLLCYVRIL